VAGSGGGLPAVDYIPEGWIFRRLEKARVIRSTICWAVPASSRAGEERSS